MATRRTDTSEDLAPAADQPSKKRRIVFRVVATLVALWFLALNLFGLTEIVLMWFPAETVAGMFDEEASYIVLHRAHFMAIGIIAWGIVLSMSVQLRKPERRVAPLLLVAIGALGGMVVFGLSGTFGDFLVEELAMVVLPVYLVVVLHPSRSELFTRPDFDGSMAVMATAATVPWLVYIVDNAWAQFRSVDGDTHAEMEHWALAALLGIFISVAAILGASDKSGWRLTGWIAAAGSLIFGVHSLVFPGLASALPAVWAVAATLWGIGYGAMIVRRSRTGSAAVPAA